MRKIPETQSAAPAMMRNSKANGNQRTKPNAAIALPQTTIEMTTQRPCARTKPNRPLKILDNRAPTAGAAAKNPRTVATSRIDPPYHKAAIAGNSARGIPNTIAIMSS